MPQPPPHPKGEQGLRLLGLGVLLLLPLLQVWRVFWLGETFFYEDLAAFYFPRELLLTRTGLTGWNPHVFLGMPLAADPQAAAWEPVRALCRLLAVPVPAALGCFLLVYLAIATAGVWRLALRRGASSTGALLAVLAAVWGGMFVVRFRHVHIFTTLSLLPWILLFADRLLASRRLTDGLLIGLLIAWGALGGHPQIPYMAALFVAAWLCAGALFETPPGQRLGTLWAAGWRAAAGLFAAAGLLAFYLVPVVPATLQSGRAIGRTLDWSGAFSWTPDGWLRLLAPDLFGNDLQGNFFGSNNFHEGLLYVGVAPLVLVLLALLWDGRRSLRPLLALGALGALLGAGKFTPVFYLAYYLVPGFKLFRAPCRYTFLTTLCAALVAAIVLSDIQRGERPPDERSRTIARRLRWAVGLLAALLLGGALAGRAFPSALEAGVRLLDPGPKPGVASTVSWAMLRAGSLLAVTGAVLLAWLRQRWDGRRTALALLLLTALDLALQWGPYRQTRPLPEAFPDARLVSALTGAAPARVLVYAHGAGGGLWIEPLLNWGEAAGYEDLRGYNPAAPAGISRLFRRGDRDRAPRDRQPDLAAVWDPEEWLLDLTGVGRVAAPAGCLPERLRGLPLVARAGGWEVRERASAFPRAWLVSAAEVLPDEASLARLGQLELRRVATVDRPVGLPERDAGDAGTARLLHLSADEVAVEVEARRPALLVLADAHAPGWEADVDGTKAPVAKADFMFRGVRVEAGRHRVSFRYRAIGLEAGRWITLATAALLAALFGVLAWRRRGRLGGIGTGS